MEEVKDKLPGSGEPVSGKCGGQLRRSLEKYGVVRYCTRPAGWKTPHPAIGRCTYHGGSSPNHIKSAERAMAETEGKSLMAALGDPEPLMPAVVEMEKLIKKAKAWSIAIESMIGDLNEVEVTDRVGIEHVRARVELLERAWDRLQKYLEFAMKYDIADRKVQLQAEQGRMIGLALVAIFHNAHLALTDEQIDMSQKLLRSALTELAPYLQPSWADPLEIESEETEIDNG